MESKIYKSFDLKKFIKLLQPQVFDNQKQIYLNFLQSCSTKKESANQIEERWSKSGFDELLYSMMETGKFFPYVSDNFKLEEKKSFKVDEEYKKRLLNDATSAIRELSYQGRQGENMVVVENTPKVHNVVVCTLCSCYPWPVLGLPPTWYKSDEYRSRTVREPRKVLSEFGLSLDPKVQIKVWDSTAELRYLVLPMRPDGTENMDETELAELVTRNSMIGTGLPKEIK